MRFSKAIIMFHPVGAGLGHVRHHVARMGGGIVEKENAQAGGDTLSTELGRGGGCGAVDGGVGEVRLTRQNFFE